MSKGKRSETWFWVLLGLAALSAYAFFGRGVGDSGGGSFRSFAGDELPSLSSGGTWLNSPQPVSWDSLAGQVVWLEFSFLH